MSATAESDEMISSRTAAGELLLHKLQKKYYSLNMPKDKFEKLENFENVEEEEEEEEEGGVSDDTDDDEEGEGVRDEPNLTIDHKKLYIIKREEVAHKDFEEMVRFYLNDSGGNLSDFRDLVFADFYSYERSSIREISAEYGIVGEYRRSKKGVVVLVSKIKTLYKNSPWLFVQVMLHYKDDHFQDWNLVKPGDTEICHYDTVKFIDEDKLD